MQDLFHPSDYPDLLVGLSTPDDAAVWRLDETRALVVTTDFFTPIVDEPYAYGAIAAANSLSDVYAMGGRPFLALNIAALPESLPTDVSSEILRGGADKAREAGVVVAGGHTVKDREPKYGLVAVGFVDPRQMLDKKGLRPGDRLVLTKPLGTGLITTALKQDQADAGDVAGAILSMSRLNQGPSELAVKYKLHGGTDITGFGLLGHGLEMAEASRCRLNIRMADVPFLEGARKYAVQHAFAGGLFDNQAFFGSRVHFAPGVEETEQLMLFDPQTSGGLLLGVPEQKLEGFMARAAELRQTVWEIGSVESGEGIRVE